MVTFWRGQAPVYAKHRSRLVDLPGHGRSDTPDVAYTQERFARAIDAVLRDARVERAVLVGHSMGGPVALTFLRLFPDKVKGIVLVDAFIPEAPKDDEARAKRKSQAEAMAKAWRRPEYRKQAEQMIESMFSDKTGAAERRAIRSTMLAAPHVMASAFEGMFTMEPPGPGEVYRVPAMAVMVKRSRPEYEEQLRGLFPNLTKYEEWEGAGHFLMLESPERFNALLEGFLAGLR